MMARIRDFLHALRWPVTAVCAILLVIYAYSLQWTTAVSFGGIMSEWNHDMVQGWLICCLPTSQNSPNTAQVHDTFFVSNISFRGISRFGLGIPYRLSFGSTKVIGIPLGTLLLLMGAMSLIAWIARRRGIPVGSCVHCGYNLTGNVSGVCPECEAVVESGSIVN